MQVHLQGLQHNTNALRKQLSQLRNIQVSVCLLKMYFTYIRVCVCVCFHLMHMGVC